VRVDDGDDRSRAQRVVDQLERGGGRLLRRQHVEHDPAGVALDEADVGQVEATHLPDAARHDLVQAVGHVEHGQALQRWVDAVELLVTQQEIVAAHVPGDVAGLGHDLPVGRRRDESALRFLEVAPVLERQGGALAILQLDRVLRRGLSLGMEVLRHAGGRIRGSCGPGIRRGDGRKQRQQGGGNEGTDDHWRASDHVRRD
jgi:hypothetical protein